MRRNWRQEAETAIEQLRMIRHGDREREMVAIARNVSDQADASGLRRAIAAYEFLNQLESENPDAHAALRSAPLAVVSALGNWYAFDQTMALRFARDYGEGIGTAKSIAESLRSARRGHAGQTGTALARAYGLASEALVIEGLETVLGRKVGRPERSVRDGQTGAVVDFLFSVADARGLLKIAVLVVGPYSNPRLYAHRRADWVTKGFGLGWFYDRVLLALPDKDHLKDYQRCALVEPSERSAWAPADGPRLDVFCLSVPRLTIEEDEAVGLLADVR